MIAPCGHVDCNQDREIKMVVVKPGVPDETGRPRGGVWCDPCIVPLVKALNDAGIPTVASCCGHGHRSGLITLADGRELIIARDFDEARMIGRLFPIDINGDQAPRDAT
jgi:hypothetical protein